MCHIFEAMPLARRPKPYLDDVFNGKGRDFDDHLSILAEIFTLLMEAGMQVNLTKSPLCAKVVEFMGMLMKQHGYQPTPKRVESILKIAPPKTVSEVRRFVGTINFIKNHIPNRAAILAPITQLTKKNVPWTWKEEQEKAFDEIKVQVSKAMLLVYPDPNRKFILYPDASQKLALGVMLMQEFDKTELCVGTHSRKFTDAELKYPIGQLEFLASFDGCRHFHNIIYGCEIEIRSDHMNNTRINTKHVNLRLMRQRIELDQVYAAKITHSRRRHARC